MSEKNTAPEQDLEEEGYGPEQEKTREDILMQEEDILRGMIEAGREKNDETSYETIEIRRAGKLYFVFRIRPVTEEESIACHDAATKFAPRKRGQPKREIETNGSKFRSWLIYTATVEEDRKKTWDNRRAQDAFGVIEAVDLVDAILLPGEKDRVIDRINDISGYGDDFEETAKN